jgi:hypothetical protein
LEKHGTSVPLVFLLGGFDASCKSKRDAYSAFATGLPNLETMVSNVSNQTYSIGEPVYCEARKAPARVRKIIPD